MPMLEMWCPFPCHPTRAATSLVPWTRLASSGTSVRHLRNRLSLGIRQMWIVFVWVFENLSCPMIRPLMHSFSVHSSIPVDMHLEREVRTSRLDSLTFVRTSKWRNTVERPPVPLRPAPCLWAVVTSCVAVMTTTSTTGTHSRRLPWARCEATKTVLRPYRCPQMEWPLPLAVGINMFVSGCKVIINLCILGSSMLTWYRIQHNKIILMISNAT